MFVKDMSYFKYPKITFKIVFSDKKDSVFIHSQVLIMIRIDFE